MKTDPSDAHANVLVHARPSFIVLLRGVNQIFLPCSVVSVELYESDQEVFVRQKEAMAFNRLP